MNHARSRFVRPVTWPLVSLVLASASAATPPVRYLVPMSDGILLATDVYAPRDSLGGPRPAILYRTPYGIATNNIPWVTEYGYVAVCQDVRGRHDSQGVNQMFRDDGWGPDHQDGLDTVSWILAQPWSDGTIGTYGGSAMGMTQNLLAGALPPSVRCMHVKVAAADHYADMAFPGGAFRKYDVESWVTGQQIAYMLDSLAAHPNDDAWWAWTDATARHALETIPTYQIGGWYDVLLAGNLKSFTGLQYGGGPGARGNQKLVVGPWTHGGIGNPHAGQLTYPPNATLTAAEALTGTWPEWAAYWLRGVPNGVMDRPPIAYYVMGAVGEAGAPGNVWRTGDVWPPAAVETPYCLHEGGRLGVDPPAPSEAPESYAYDPLDPVPTVGGANLALPRGPYDQRPVESRPDVLVYSTPVLAEPIEIEGPVVVNLYIASDRADTDFTAKLTDVYPDGRSMLVCDGILRARHHLSLGSEDFLVPGQVYLMRIDLWETAIIFAAGHRIRLAVSSSNYPRFDANPNTGAPFGQDDSTLVAANTIHHEPLLPSHLLLRVTGATAAVAAAGGPRAAGALRILAAAPNPFGPATTVHYELGEPGRVAARVYDVAGRFVRELRVAAPEGAGRHAVAWDGRDAAGRPAAGGVYWLRLEAGEKGEASAARRLVRIP